MRAAKRNLHESTVQNNEFKRCAGLDLKTSPSADRRLMRGRSNLVWTALLALAMVELFCVVPAFALSKEKREAATALFHKTGCEYCHGVNGMGSEKAPDLSAVGKRRKREQIEQQILKGGNGMPAFGEILPSDDVKTLVDYLSSRKKAGR